MSGNPKGLSPEQLVERFARAVANWAPAAEGLVISSSADADAEQVRLFKAELLWRLTAWRLFDKPQGPATKGPVHSFGDLWGIGNRPTTEAITCQLCGTEFPADPELPRIVSRFGRITIVDTCCGAWIDQLFDVLGQAFFRARLEQIEKEAVHAPEADPDLMKAIAVLGQYAG